MAELYNPDDLTTEDLLKRIKVSNQTRDFVRSSTGIAICERAIGEYSAAIKSLTVIVVVFSYY